MKNNYLAAYEYYKKQYSNNIILFHIENEYYVFESDAFIVANIHGGNIMYNKAERYSWYSFHESELTEMFCYIAIKGNHPVTTVEYRDENGSFTIPKVNQIEQDIEDDY